MEKRRSLFVLFSVAFALCAISCISCSKKTEVKSVSSVGDNHSQHVVDYTAIDKLGMTRFHLKDNTFDTTQAEDEENPFEQYLEFYSDVLNSRYKKAFSLEYQSRTEVKERLLELDRKSRDCSKERLSSLNLTVTSSGDKSITGSDGSDDEQLLACVSDIFVNGSLPEFGDSLIEEVPVFYHFERLDADKQDGYFVDEETNIYGPSFDNYSETTQSRAVDELRRMGSEYGQNDEVKNTVISIIESCGGICPTKLNLIIGQNGEIRGDGNYSEYIFSADEYYCIQNKLRAASFPASNADYRLEWTLDYTPTHGDVSACRAKKKAVIDNKMAEIKKIEETLYSNIEHQKEIHNIPEKKGYGVFPDVPIEVLEAYPSVIRKVLDTCHVGYEMFLVEVSAEMTVAPNGKVNEIEVQVNDDDDDDGAIEDSPVQACVVDVLEKEVFPSFDGDARTFNLHFIVGP